MLPAAAAEAIDQRQVTPLHWEPSRSSGPTLNGAGGGRSPGRQLPALRARGGSEPVAHAGDREPDRFAFGEDRAPGRPRGPDRPGGPPWVARSPSSGRLWRQRHDNPSINRSQLTLAAAATPPLQRVSAALSSR